MTEIAGRLDRVRGEIVAAAQAAGRSPDSVELLAVSKRHPATLVREAQRAGQRHFGENRVQELLAKSAELRDVTGLRWHMIGSLQTNKVADLLRVGGLTLLHSLDRVRLADVLQVELAATQRRLDVLLQVHATDEASKHGCAIAQVDDLLRHVQAHCPALSVCGVMAMGPLEGDPAPVFARIAALVADLRQRHALALSTLSMGMSGDLGPAIAAGSTLVRVGTAVFGSRG